jgi:tetratricopeptide (TPR) repeat protein
VGLTTRTWHWLWSRCFRRLADAHRHFGNLYGNMQEHWAAVENYTRAIVLDPAYVEAYYCRGILYWREIGNYYRAIQDLSRVLELDPGRADAYFNRGVAYSLHQDREQAIADMERYLVEGTDPFWLDSARRQLAEMRGELGLMASGEL